tara:strand:- start:200 stop:913 length:714 start_codon:yes stop_codon:yes gene_type:complete
MLLALALWPVSAWAAEEVDLELVLLADASGSIDQAEIEFQRRGYADAIRHPEVLAAIAEGLLGRIAVTYVEWGNASSIEVVVPWTIVDGAGSAAQVASVLIDTPRMAYGYNAIGSAINFGEQLIESNDLKGLRKVIDLSADSANNWDGIPIEAARQSAMARGITINGLAILCREHDCSGRPIDYDLEDAFARTIIGGPGSFVVTVDGHKEFAEAVRRKLILEIAARPDIPRLAERER